MNSFAKVCPRCGTRYDAAAAFCQRDGVSLRLLEEEVDARIGQVLLEQFRIEERIGQGGMGAVYRARQTTLDRDVAIKILHPDLAQNADAVRRFHREARISTALDHPNVVRVFLFGQLPDGSLYLVMELLRGRTLAELLRTEALPVHRALHIATQVADGVGEAHGQGIVHRDVKPENVFLVTKGRDPDFVKVLDFGIARVFRGADQTSATQAGLVFGTARYISPEGAAGERTDARSDVYSLGVLAYQLLTGETPFDGASPVTMLMAHIHDSPPHVHTRRGGRHVPDAVADVVMRALSKNPEARYEDASEFGETLRGAAQRAGFDVIRLRGGNSSITSLPHERHDPSGPLIRDRKKSGSASQSASHTMALPRGRGSSTLDGAPNPFSAPTGEVRVPGLGKRSAFFTVFVAFLAGLMLVAGGFFVASWSPSDPIAMEADELLRRAEAALGAGQYDAPEGDSVRVLTDRVLAMRPGDADARRIRRAAADALATEGEDAEERDNRVTARDRFQRALSLVADHEAARAGLTRIEEAEREPEREAHLAFVPAAPVAGTPVSLTATLATGMRVGAEDRPRFVVRRGEQRVGRRADARAGSEPGTWVATYTFPSAGRYRVSFLTRDEGETRIELTTELDVSRPPRSTSPSSDPPPVTIQGSGPAAPFPRVVDAPPPARTTPEVAFTPIPTPVPVASPPPTIQPLAPPPPPPSPPSPPPPPTPWTSGS